MTRVDLGQEATRREQILFGVVVLVLIVLFFRIFYGGQAKKQDLSQGRLNALKAEKEALVKFSAFTPMIERGATLSRKKGIKVKILTGEIRSDYGEMSVLLQEVTEPGFLGGVKVENLSYLPPMPDQGYTKSDFTINVRGSFMEVLRYLERLEQFPALFEVSGVSFKVAEGQPQDVQAEILGRFFRLGTESPAGMVLPGEGPS